MQRVGAVQPFKDFVRFAAIGTNDCDTQRVVGRVLFDQHLNRGIRFWLIAQRLLGKRNRDIVNDSARREFRFLHGEVRLLLQDGDDRKSTVPSRSGRLQFDSFAGGDLSLIKLTNRDKAAREIAIKNRVNRIEADGFFV